MEKETQLNIRLSYDLRDQLEQLAQDQGEKSVSTLVRKILSAAVHHEREAHNLVALERRIMKRFTRLEKLLTDED